MGSRYSKIDKPVAQPSTLYTIYLRLGRVGLLKTALATVSVSQRICIWSASVPGISAIYIRFFPVSFDYLAAAHFALSDLDIPLRPPNLLEPPI